MQSPRGSLCIREDHRLADCRHPRAVDHSTGDGWWRRFEQQPIPCDLDVRIRIASHNVWKRFAYPAGQSVSALLRSPQLILKLRPTQMKVGLQPRQAVRKKRIQI